MTFTQNSFSNSYQNDSIEVILPKKKSNGRATVCIPETVPSAAMHATSKTNESAAPFTIICILLLCAVMLFLIINAFTDIKTVEQDLTNMQGELQLINQNKNNYSNQLQQAYNTIDMEQAANQLGLEKQT